MNYKEILTIASNEVLNLKNRTVNVIDLIKPADVDYAIQISRIISKLSPLIGNMLEMATVNALNTVEWENNTKWKRQDPGFPDAIYDDPSMEIKPGIEIHHKKPVYQYEEKDVDAVLSSALDNLVPVCSNCHRMLHHKKGITFEEVKIIYDKIANIKNVN